MNPVTWRIVVALLALGSPAGAAADPVFPGKEWAEATPQSRGVDPAKLEEAMKYFAGAADRPGDKGLGVQRAVVVRDGYVIWKGSDVATKTPIYSATKSFTSTVLGLLVADGKCTVDTRAAEHLPGMKKLYPDLKLRHFATMTSGYDGEGGTRCGKKPGDLFDGSDTYDTPAAPVFAPGTKYLYWDDSMRQFINTLSHVAGEDVKAVFERRVGDPIGMTEWDWRKMKEIDGIEMNGQVEVSARDLARFGLLFLNRGKWKDKQLVDEKWVAEATRVHVPATLPLHPVACEKADGRGVYGYNWWVNGVQPDGKRMLPSAPAGTFMALGHYHNACFVIPEWRIVIVRLGTTERPANAREIWDTFLGKVGAALLPPRP